MCHAWVLVPLILACGCVYPTPKSVSSTYVHVELLKFKGEGTEQATQEVLADVEDLLVPIPALKGFWVGRPVPGTSTPQYAIDADYDVGLVLMFDSPQGLQTYREHPAYVRFQERNRDRFDVRVLAFSPFGGPPRS